MAQAITRPLVLIIEFLPFLSHGQTTRLVDSVADMLDAVGEITNRDMVHDASQSRIISDKTFPGLAIKTVQYSGF